MLADLENQGSSKNNERKPSNGILATLQEKARNVTWVEVVIFLLLGIVVFAIIILDPIAHPLTRSGSNAPADEENAEPTSGIIQLEKSNNTAHNGVILMRSNIKISIATDNYIFFLP